MIINVGYITRRTNQTIVDALEDYDIHVQGPEVDRTIKDACHQMNHYRSIGHESKVYRVKVIVQEVRPKRRKSHVTK